MMSMTHYSLINPMIKIKLVALRVSSINSFRTREI